MIQPRGRCAALVAVLLVYAAGPTTLAVAGGGQLPPRTKEFTLAGAPFVSHGISGSPDGLTGFYIVPHLGIVVTEEVGPAPLRGQLELLAEPTLVHVDGSDPTDVLGLALAGRWLFVGPGRARSYVEVGAGATTGQSRLPRNDCDVLFTLQGGVGVLLFFGERHAVTLGYRFHHLSNGKLCIPNQGLNASMILIGLTTFLD